MLGASPSAASPWAEVHIPRLRLRSEANSRDHYMAKARRVKHQREIVTLILQSRLGLQPPKPPLRVTITRIAPRALDSDNLVSSAKAVRDAVATWLGIDDRDPCVEYHYAQEKERPGEYAVKIRFAPSRWNRLDSSVVLDLGTNVGAPVGIPVGEPLAAWVRQGSSSSTEASDAGFVLGSQGVERNT